MAWDETRWGQIPRQTTSRIELEYRRTSPTQRSLGGAAVTADFDSRVANELRAADLYYRRHHQVITEAFASIGGDPHDAGRLAWSSVCAKLQSMGERISEEELAHCLEVPTSSQPVTLLWQRLLRTVVRSADMPWSVHRKKSGNVSASYRRTKRKFECARYFHEGTCLQIQQLDTYSDTGTYCYDVCVIHPVIKKSSSKLLYYCLSKSQRATSAPNIARFHCPCFVNIGTNYQILHCTHTHPEKMYVLYLVYLGYML